MDWVATERFRAEGLGVRGMPQRFEVKYVVSEKQALAIKEYATPYVTPDPHGLRYTVTSLYLDTPGLAMYQSSVAGEKNRHKLRIRNYGDGPVDTVFFEVKRRMNQTVKKHRAAVRRRFVDDVLRGASLGHDMLASPDDEESMANLGEFRDVMEVMAATPRTVVQYMREALVGSVEENIRITFDRGLAGLQSQDYAPEEWDARGCWHDQLASPVILEIKFTDIYPAWVGHLVRRFNLVSDSIAKYVVCVASLQRYGF